MRMLVAIGGKDCLFIATANGIDSLPAALRRRLGVLGIWFVDLPDQTERESIGKLQVARHKVTDKKAVPYFKSSEGWSGANIRDCCRGAFKRQVSVEDAARFIVPASIQEGEGLTVLRSRAAGKFLSTAYAGMYHLPSGVEALPELKVRKVGLIAEVEETPATPAIDKSKLN
jgi:SpoVK/Ycf46/Vps4 family AAA+-type ATPase